MVDYLLLNGQSQHRKKAEKEKEKAEVSNFAKIARVSSLMKPRFLFITVLNFYQLKVKTTKVTTIAFSSVCSSYELDLYYHIYLFLFSSY